MVWLLGGDLRVAGPRDCRSGHEPGFYLRLQTGFSCRMRSSGPIPRSTVAIASPTTRLRQRAAVRFGACRLRRLVSEMRRRAEMAPLPEISRRHPDA